MLRLFAIGASVIVLTAMVTITTAQVDMPFGGYYCFVRCIAKCMANTTGTLPTCRNQCTKYNSSSLCGSIVSDRFCWQLCNDLADGSEPTTRPPKLVGLKAVFREENPRLINITWAPDPLVSLYVLEYDDQFDNWTNPKRKEMTTPMLLDFMKPRNDFCNQYTFRVASVTAHGVSPFSNEFVLPVPVPKMEPILNVLLHYSNEQYNFMDYYKSNGTIDFTIKYSNLTNWPLGANDITVDVVVAMIGCDMFDLHSAMPTPVLRIPGVNLLTTKMSSDMMKNRCQLMYYPTAVKSEECDSSYTMPMSPYYIRINCENVRNSNCSSDIKLNEPLCGLVTDFKAKLLNPEKVDVNNLASNISAEISFKPITRLTNVNNKIPLYYIAVYGDATQFDNDRQTALQGVNMSNTIGQVTTCDRLKRNEICNGNTTTAVISGIQFDRQYGVMVCAVFDKNNQQLPRIDPSDGRTIKIRAEGLLINSEDEHRSSSNKSSNTLKIVSIAVPVAVAIVAIIAISGAILFCWRKKQRERRAVMDMKMSKLNDELEAHRRDMS